jgi:hypothetical protein
LRCRLAPSQPRRHSPQARLDGASAPAGQNHPRRRKKLETRLRRVRESFHFTNTHFARSFAPASGKIRIRESADGGFFARCQNNLIENGLSVTFFVDECIAEAQ